MIEWVNFCFIIGRYSEVVNVYDFRRSINFYGLIFFKTVRHLTTKTNIIKRVAKVRISSTSWITCIRIHINSVLNVVERQMMRDKVTDFSIVTRIFCCNYLDVWTSSFFYSDNGKKYVRF